MSDNNITAVNNDKIPLEISRLYKKYSPKANYAVEDISFRCGKGLIMGILGPNGAGKSTILKCLTGMIPISEGEIKICGFSIKDQPVAAKRNFSFVTDNHAVFVKMTGLQYLAFMADVYGVPTVERAERIKELDKAFQLGDSVKNLISSYSHGMKQKICMMGSLMHSPQLWIMDEPMLGLDPRTQGAVIAFMKRYVADGKTILFSSHNLDVVQRICDRAVIINKGRIVEDIIIADFMRDNPQGLQKYYVADEE
ncbi:MAG: ABC transporter ATP-binding protein [Clostridia bacterium]|nr:ABC transporter ATP-binding protein [Clostridia bacterium]